MKTGIAVLLVGSLVTCLFAANQQRLERVDRLELRELVIRSDDGKHAITIRGSKHMVGLWASTGDRAVAIASGEDIGTFFGMYDGKQPIPFAVAIDDCGARVQILDAAGGVHTIKAEHLLGQ